MEYIFILILIGVVVILLIRASGSSSGSDSTASLLSDLKNEIGKLQKEVSRLQFQVDSNATDIKEKIDELKSQNSYVPPAPVVALAPEIVPEPEIAPVAPPVIEPITEPIPASPVEEAINLAGYRDEEEENEWNEAQEAQQPVAEEVVLIEPYSAKPAEPKPQPGPVYEPQESGFDRWLQNNPDLEKFIGENLINKIGIAILVLGIAFFVKYAIDQEWINEIGRVCIGIACGGILVGVAHYMRNTYRSFSSVLAGGGIAVFYFTIAFAFHQYHLMSQTAAFVIMVVITGFAIALSVLYNKLELAIIATVGGFITPFLVSTGDGNYVVLFTYLIILNAGILSLSYFKRWPAINIIALFFTEIIYGGWLTTVIDNPAKHFSYPVALGFAAVYYFIFLGMNMINQVKTRTSFRAFDFSILLLISSSFYAAGMVLLHGWNNGEYQGLFTLGMGLVNLGLTYFIYKNGKADRNLLFLLIGLTLTFITLTIPIQLHGHAITLFWSAEFVLLYWLADYSGIRMFRLSSALLCVLTLFSLALDWQKAALANPDGLHLIFSNLQGIVTNLVAIGAFGVMTFLLLRNRDKEDHDYSPVLLAEITFVIAVATLYLTAIFGVNLYFRMLHDYTIPNVYYQMITSIFALVFIVLIQRKTLRLNHWVPVAFFALCFIVMIVSEGDVIDLRNDILMNHFAFAHFVGHWIDVALIGAIIWLNIQGIRRQKEKFAEALTPLTTFFSIVIIVILSVELLHIYTMIGYKDHNISGLEGQYGKAGLTVLWALCSFALMWMGMGYRHKPFRIISLVLFSIVLVKLFAFDISEISKGGKILAFILLGVLLLTVSFMYQKFKYIIIDDKKE